MKFHRFLNRDCVQLGMACDRLEPPNPELPAERRLWIVKEAVIAEAAQVLDRSGAVSNVTKLTKDLIFAEKKATSGIGEGYALPHVRTLRAREFVMGFCRSDKGLDFAGVDGEPVHFFFPMVAPPYDDKVYTRIYKELGMILQEPTFKELLREAETADDIIWGLQSYASC